MSLAGRTRMVAGKPCLLLGSTEAVKTAVWQWLGVEGRLVVVGCRPATPTVSSP